MNQQNRTNEAIDVFCSITGATPNEAARFLSMARGNINTAVSLYYSYEDELIRRQGRQKAGANKESSSDSSSGSSENSYSGDLNNNNNNTNPHSQRQARGNIVNFSDFQNTPQFQQGGNGAPQGGQQGPRRDTHQADNGRKPKQKRVTKKKPLFVKKKSSHSLLKFKSILFGIDLTKEMGVVTRLNAVPVKDYDDALKRASSEHKPLLIFVHSPGNTMSKKMLKMLEEKRVAALVKDRFVFYATSIYHDDFDDFLSLSLSSASRPSEPGGGAPGVMGSIGGISGITEGEGAEGLVEYPYIGIVMPFGVDGVQRPRRIPVQLVRTEELLFRALRKVIGREGGKRIENVEDVHSERKEELKESVHISSSDPNLVDASDSNDKDNSPPLEYALRDAFGKAETVSLSQSATVGDLLSIALRFAQQGGSVESVSIICRNPPLRLSSESDPSQLLAPILPSQSSLIVVFGAV